MKEDKILREFIRDTISERLFFDKSSKDDTSNKVAGFLKKLKSFFQSEAGKIVDSWIEDQEMYYDVEIPDDMKRQIFAYAEKKMSHASDRIRSKPEKLEKAMNKMLDVKFGASLRSMDSDFDDDNEEESIFKKAARRFKK
jgi:hypothetical protein